MKKLYFALMISLLSSPAYAIDWSKVDGKELTLFYPGQASWEWLLTKHKGSKSLRKGAPCMECHETEEKQMGNTLASGKKLEPTPVAGKPGSVKMTVKAAVDAQFLYIQAQWQDPGFNSGQKQDSKHESKLALMFDTGKVKAASVAGCWGVCHTDASNMPAADGAKRELYVSKSRQKLTRNGGGDNIVSKGVLSDLLDDEGFMEYWQARFTQDGNATAVSGYILEERHAHSSSPVTVTAQNKNGLRTVEFKRKIRAKGQGIKTLNADTPLQIGFAIHDDYTTGRFHYVSFGQSLSLNNSNADLKAKHF